LVDAFVAEQRRLTAVERFSQRQADARAPLLEQRYRALLPATHPGPGEQYAFEVDLDQCSSCKACVVACHSLNGLEPEESWREIRLMVGSRPVPQTPRPEAVTLAVTSACHHCVDPGCLKGCPVLAYEKDPLTGIVRHLDDQCIGCSYCIFTCPYEVPKFSESRGIVRKCDLCQGRLQAGEAPACVQACPNEAIRITRVPVAATIDRCRGEGSTAGHRDGGCSLPGMPPASITVPSTVYRSKRPMDGLESRPVTGTPCRRDAHWPLIAMLVLTQWGGGILAAVALGTGMSGRIPTGRDAAVAALGCLWVHAGLIASVFHLGQPLKAWRIWMGWKTSWLSREALALGAFSSVSLLFTGWIAGLAWVPAFPAPLRGFQGVASGLLVLLVLTTVAQIQVYVVTGRAGWRSRRTGPRFAGTVLMGWGVGWGLMVGPSWVSILALLLLTGLSMFERWRFFAGGFLADVDSRDQERP
jgi:formate dehydrogenase iron-sulfur subunit